MIGADYEPAMAKVPMAMFAASGVGAVIGLPYSFSRDAQASLKSHIPQFREPGVYSVLTELFEVVSFDFSCPPKEHRNMELSIDCINAGTGDAIIM